MYPVCLDNIVSIKNPCDGTFVTCTSGYDIFDAPEINSKMLPNLGNSDIASGLETIKRIRCTVLKHFETDFIGLLNDGGYTTSLYSNSYSSGNYNTTTQNNFFAGERGATYHSVTHNVNSIKKSKIKKVSLYPLQTLVTNLKIYDNGIVTSIPISLVANQVNEFYIDYTIIGQEAKILIDNTNLQTYSSEIDCKTGCNGSVPNGCGYITGWNGSSETKNESFGIVVDFACECDYSYLMCLIPKNHIGKLIWLKLRIAILEHALQNGRFTNWIVYGKEDIIALIKDLVGEYNHTFKTLKQGIKELLFKYQQEGCVDCKGLQIKINV